MVRCFAAVVLLLVAAVSCGAVHVNSAAGLRRRAALVELGEVGTLQELPADVLSALPAGFTARQLDLNDEDLEAMREAASIKQSGAPEVRFAEAEAEAETMAVQKPCVPAGHTLSSVNEKDLPRSLREYIMSLQPCKDGESACLPKDLPNPDFHAFLPSWMRALPACGSAQYVGGSVNASAAPALPANAQVKEAVTTTRVDPSGKTITTTTVEERPTTVSVPPQPGQSIHTTTTVTTVHEVKVIHKKPRATDPPMARSAQMAVASLRASLREHKPHDEDKIVVDAVNKIIKLNNQDPRQGPVYRAAEKLPKYRDWRREERGTQNLARISLKKELEVHAGLSANATALLKAARSALARVYHLQNATRLVGTELTNAAQRVAAQANRTMEETLRAELAYAGNAPQKAFAAQLAADAHAAALQLNQSYTELTNLLAGLASVNNDTLNLDTTSIAGYDAAVENFNAEIAALGPKLADTVTSVEAALKNAEGPRSEQQAALKEAADVRQTIAAVQADRARWQTQVERMQERIAELDKPRE